MQPVEIKHSDNCDITEDNSLDGVVESAKSGHQINISVASKKTHRLSLKFNAELELLMNSKEFIGVHLVTSGYILKIMKLCNEENYLYVSITKQLTCEDITVLSIREYSQAVLVLTFNSTQLIEAVLDIDHETNSARGVGDMIDAIPMHVTGVIQLNIALI
jgi:hypothetical protein